MIEYREDYAIQSLMPEFGGWVHIDCVKDFFFPSHFRTLKEAQKVISRIETYHPTGREYRIVTRKVTEWEVVA